MLNYLSDVPKFLQHFDMVASALIVVSAIFKFLGHFAEDHVVSFCFVFFKKFIMVLEKGSIQNVL